MHRRHAVIIGGGISGLSAAFFLSQRSAQEDLPLKITVLESSDRFGGVLRTISHEGLCMDAGADAFYAGRSDASDLCRTLGLQDELIEAAPCFRRFFILKNKKPLAVPGLPASFAAATHFFTSPLLSIPEKCRMLGELFIPRREEKGDENLARFFCRRFGKGFFQKIAEPLIRGVYMADPEYLSLKAMFPRLGEAEQTHGSLARSFWDKKKEKKKDRPAEFLTLKTGLEAMVRALVRELRICELRRSAAVRRCVYNAGWELALENGEILRADMICLAMNARDASQLLSVAAPDLSRELSLIRYDSIASVSLLYGSGDVPARGLDFGFLVPASGESYPFSGLKWLGKTTGGDDTLLRGFISEAMLPGVFHENDEGLKRKILIPLREIFGLQAVPRFIRVERYPSALPQYEVGHLERVARIEEKVRQYPGLYLTGNGFRGFGITDCIRSARIAADQIFCRC